MVGIFLTITAVSNAQIIQAKEKSVPVTSVVGNTAISIAERIIFDLLIQRIRKNGSEKNNIVFGSNDIGFNKIDTTTLVNKINKGKKPSKNTDAQLSSFFVESIMRANNIFWTTNAERNVGGYMVEKSSDGNNFKAIGSITATNTSSLQQYTFTDVKIKDTLRVYYRIKILGVNGESNIYNPLIFEKPMLAVVYKLDTIQKLLYINSPSPVKKIEVIDISGKIIIVKKKINLMKPIETVMLPAGVYSLKVYTDDEVVSQMFFKI